MPVDPVPTDAEEAEDQAESTGKSGPRHDWDTVARIRDLFYRARSHRKPLLERWYDNYEITYNKKWSQRRQEWAPDPAVSEIWPTVNSLVAWETDTQPTFDVVPLADPNSPFYEQVSQVAADLRTVLRSVWFQSEFDPEIQKVLWDGKLYGTGISKTVWDPELAGGMGDPALRRVDVFKFYPDPDATNTRDGNYFIEVYELSDQELEGRFPGALNLIQGASTDDFDRSPTQVDSRSGQNPKANPGAISPNTRQDYGLPGQSSRASGRGVDSDRHFVIECWLKDDDNDWHCYIVTGDVVLMSEEAEKMWAHAQHPYDRYVPIETGEFWGVGLVEFLAPVQKSINRLLKAIEHNVWLAGNPVLLEDARSGIQRTKVTNKPGTRLTVNSGSRVEWMQPPQIHPQIAMQLVTFYIGEMERISGLSAIVRGATPTGRNAQGVLDSVQEAAFVRTRMALRNLESMLRSAGSKAAALIAEFYDSPRFVALVGPTGEQSVMALGGRHFYMPDLERGKLLPMRFQLQVQAGSSITTSRQARIAEADTLAAMGMIDEEAVLIAHDFPNWPQIVARVREMKAAQGMLGAAPSARSATGRTS